MSESVSVESRNSRPCLDLLDEEGTEIGLSHITLVCDVVGFQSALQSRYRQPRTGDRDFSGGGRQNRLRSLLSAIFIALMLAGGLVVVIEIGG